MNFILARFWETIASGIPVVWEALWARSPAGDFVLSFLMFPFVLVSLLFHGVPLRLPEARETVVSVIGARRNPTV